MAFKMNSLKRIAAIEKAIFIAVSTIWAFITIYPLYMVIVILFSPRSAAVFANFRFFPTSLTEGLDSLSRVISDRSFISGFVVSMVYSSAQALGMLVVTSMAAFEFTFFQFKFKKALFLLALSSLMVPLAVTIIPAFKVIVALKWLNTLPGLVVPGIASASGLFIITQFMESIPGEMLQAAEIDGASHFRKYCSIILPLSQNALMTAGILTFLTAWGNFTWPMVVTNNPDMYPISLVIAKYAIAMSTLYPINIQLGAFFLAAIPPIAIYVFFQKFIMQGIAVSGLKG